MPTTDQKSSFLTLLLKSINDWNIRLPRFVLSWFFFHRMVRNGIPRVYVYFLLHRQEFRVVFFRGMVRRNSENLHLFWLHGTEFRVVFSSAEELGTELWQFASIFVPRNGIPSCFLFRGRVRNGIPRFSVPRNNRNSVGNNHLLSLFRLPRNYFFVGNSQPYIHTVLPGLVKHLPTFQRPIYFMVINDSACS